MGKRLGTVLLIDLSDTYRGKTSGPRVRVLVSELKKLPLVSEIPTGRGKPPKVHKIVYLGKPVQCIRCKAYGHTVGHCLVPQDKKIAGPVCDSRNTRRPPGTREDKNAHPRVFLDRGTRSKGRDTDATVGTMEDNSKIDANSGGYAISIAKKEDGDKVLSVMVPEKKYEGSMIRLIRRERYTVTKSP